MEIQTRLQARRKKFLANLIIRLLCLSEMGFSYRLQQHGLFSINASLVAYGAHTGDKNYPDCRPAFSKKIESSFNQGEIDGIKSGVRKRIEIWSPYKAKLSKKQLLKKGYDVLGDKIFNTWSCYKNGKVQCGKCESCNNRKAAFLEAGIDDKTLYSLV